VSDCFSPGTPVSSTNKTDRHDITEILLKVSLNTTILTPTGILAVNRELVRGSLNPVRGRINLERDSNSQNYCYSQSPD
jgi:hypothetical protein